MHRAAQVARRNQIVCGLPGGDYKAELRRLNRLLERTKGYREAVVTKNGMQVMERCRVDSADELIALERQRGSAA